MRDNGVKLLAAYRSLTEAIHRRDTLPPAAEWLTDNFHIVEDQIREIQEDLPPEFYKELPKISLGELVGYPRIYAIALALVAHTDSQLELETIKKFVDSYQKISPLKIGEIWALAITLRLVLVENLRRLAIRIVADHEKRNLANHFADQLFEAVGDQENFQQLVSRLPSHCVASIEDDSAFFGQIAKRLRDQEPGLWPALESLEQDLAKKKSTVEHVAHLSSQVQAANQVTVANIITSMRLLSSLNWRDFFEHVSLIDRILEKDAYYKRMDFLTRDRYRHVIETVSKSTGSSEIMVANLAMDLARNNPDSTDLKRSHVGYYLIARGRHKLEEKLKYKPITKVYNFLRSSPNLVYFGLLLGLLALTFTTPIYYVLEREARLSVLIGIVLLIIIPCSDLALILSNLILTHIIKPKNLPKLDLTKGIPDDAKTMVVIPCMLAGPEVITDLIRKLEIHYLGNSDNQLSFALLTDFTDSSAEHAPADDLNIKTALDGITILNQKYPSKNGERFFLFNRRRQWSPFENTWMGWERKRGKIHEFNRLLRGDKNTSFNTITAPIELLAATRFVIALDADTQLPRDAARKLVGTILHPLNQPHFDKVLGRVTEGHGVLQPRIGISLESSTRSYFANIFSNYTGLDPYTTAASDVYQDLFHEGNYVGKGLYDVDAFMAATENRIPENSVLSHDLFEGLYARAALLTDVELVDDYPRTYHAFFTRQHRWVRGDWQIAAWILPFVPNGQRKWVRNQLPIISKWKLFDNLRRSLVAPTTFLWLVLAWQLPGSALFWVSCVAFIILFPAITQKVIEAIKMSFQSGPRKSFSSGIKVRVNLLQALLYTSFLAHQAFVQIDAIFRVFYRKNISNSKLLEWTTAAAVENQKTVPFWQQCWTVEISLALLGVAFVWSRPQFEAIGLILISLWMSYPLISKFMSRKPVRKTKIFSANDRLLLRVIARQTWNYFESFVNDESNWLPPDNHQEVPNALTAHRTSPTNIGLYILSLISACDFGFIGTIKFMKLLARTIESMRKLELHEGHYLNWYDIKSLTPLLPKYISTVDSGNLAGYLLVAKQSCFEIQNNFVVDAKILDGLKDIFSLIDGELRILELVSHDVTINLEACRQLLYSQQAINEYSSWYKMSDSLIHVLVKAKNSLLSQTSPEKDLSKIISWIDKALSQIQEVQTDLHTLVPWVTPGQLSNLPEALSQRWLQFIKAFDQNVPLLVLAGLYDGIIAEIQDILLEATNPSILVRELTEFVHALENGKSSIGQLMLIAEDATQFFEQTFQAMNFDFLLDKKRGVFTIGYNITNSQFDTGLYDLLASESRLASFIAIAKGDAPQEHWFRLGRSLVPIDDGRALVSWTASMFEYLMPLLVMRDYENTLINETAHAVVTRQISYGNEHHIPWGVSEAGYNARDLQMNYQYGPFGIPGLGLKRGLSHDLVISPYSTLLAAMVNPTAALSNLKRLIDNELLTSWGFYESVDYTADRLPKGQKYAVIRSFMAHHQGMSLVAINNVIHSNTIQNRFHREPRVSATRLLLQERIPQGVTPVLPKAAEIELEEQHFSSSPPIVRQYTQPSASNPRIQLLSNRNYSVMISTAGGGYSKCGDNAISRWKEDSTRDHWGNFIFIRGAESLWSTSYQPFAQLPDSYQVTFSEEKVEFKRRDEDILTHTQIIVAPEDNVEIRHITLTNESGEDRILELTSYLEPVLSPMAADLNHIAFSKLFIETEFITSKNTLIAKRRKRSIRDREIWGLHVVVTDGKIITDIQYETDRSKFIGRGRTLTNAIALTSGQDLSNTSGATIDPILSLRIKVLVKANSKTQVGFATGVAMSREEVLALADRYHDIHSFERESKMAWTKSQVDMRHLDIDSEAAYLYQRLAERILYSEPSLKPPAHQRAANTNVQSSLWPSGISGDIPIVIVSIKDQSEIAVVRKLLRCHEYLRLKGLIYDFVILNEQGASYFLSLQEELGQLVRMTGSQTWMNKPGGIFILRGDVTPERDIAHIRSVARVSLAADESLKDQINRKSIEEKYPGPLLLTAKPFKDPVPPSKALELDFSNGLGGFSKDGREYIIQLESQKWTPAPWLNVIGNNSDFGFQVSESGAGFTWSINSQTNRLTPWSNDPVSDSPGEIIYLRDDDTGEVWSPTPLPIRDDAPYTIRHGQGYTIFEHTSHGLLHSLTLFAPRVDSIKISLLKIQNLSERRRRISVTSYTEWVLGSQKEKTSPFLVCDVDPESRAIFTTNPHDNEFATRVAFADITSQNRSFTCSRKEFIGRNGNYANPAALKRRGLSLKSATGQDPCAALQTSIQLEPTEVYEIAALLGQSENTEAARELILRYRDLNTVRSALTEVKDFWRDMIDIVQVKTPDRAMDILLNNWLLYQTLSCRYWSRTAFYQSGGAYGFRDQLQDCMAFVYSAPHLTREHILRASAHQFKEGDVQHWWHPPTGRGIRTRMSDDLLWLPFVVSHYIQVTGDKAILDEKITFLESPLLRPGEEDSYTLPQISNESASLFEHCIRAINHALPTGTHGLPLIGTGDWNDGMNQIGAEGKGESIWLGWFFYKVLADFLPFCVESDQVARYQNHMTNLKLALEKEGWDVDWYKRAYFDDGTPLGSVENEECKMDSIAQSWAVLSGAGDRTRVERAMQKLAENLVLPKAKLVLLLAPPFDKSAMNPGYIKGYVPGVRENGGQYTHAAIWAMMAFAKLNQGNKAYEIFSMLNPILHSSSEAEALKYKIEPYVLAGDVYAGAHEGRGGWSWYTGSSSWYYRAGLEYLLGFSLRGNQLKITPRIPNSWKSYEISYQFKQTKYLIEVQNPEALSTGNVLVQIDGSSQQGPELLLVDDGETHKVTMILTSKLSGTSELKVYSDLSKL